MKILKIICSFFFLILIFDSSKLLGGTTTHDPNNKKTDQMSLEKTIDQLVQEGVITKEQALVAKKKVMSLTPEELSKIQQIAKDKYTTQLSTQIQIPMQTRTPALINETDLEAQLPEKFDTRRYQKLIQEVDEILGEEF